MTAYILLALLSAVFTEGLQQLKPFACSLLSVINCILEDWTFVYNVNPTLSAVHLLFARIMISL